MDRASWANRVARGERRLMSGALVRGWTVYVALCVGLGGACGPAPFEPTSGGPSQGVAGERPSESKLREGERQRADSAPAAAEAGKTPAPLKSGVRIISTGPRGRVASGSGAPQDSAESGPVAAKASAKADAERARSDVGPTTPRVGATPSESSPALVKPTLLNWSELVAIEVLEAEVKATVEERLAGWLVSLGRFNTARREIEWEGSYLAALAGIVELHDGGAGWQPRAAEVRGAALEIVEASSTAGAASFNQAKEALARIKGALSRESRSAPAASRSGPGASHPRQPPFQWEDVAELSVLMKRMDRADKQLASGLQNEAAWARGGEKLAYEASLIAALAQVGLAFEADEGAHVGWMSDLRAQAVQLAAAARERDFLKAKQSHLAATNLCKTCHAKYRFETGEKF